MTKRTGTIKRQPRAFIRVVEVSFDVCDEVADLDSEPSEVISRKAEAISELLGCSYEQAEKLVIGFSE